MNLDNVYLKYLIRAHTIIGVFVIFIFFISTYFGTITLFKPYLSSWESTSRHFSISNPSNLNLDLAIKNGLEKLKNPNSGVQIELPSFREKALSIKYGFSEKVYINPNTNEIIDTRKDTNLLSNFFNRMHIDLNIPKTGQILMGLISIAIIFLTISGIYLWLLNRKKRTNIKSFWFKWHKDLSLIILPYILVFSMTGAVLGVMLLGSAPFALSATDGQEANMSKLVRPIVFSAPCRVKASGESASMQSISKLYTKAQKEYPNLQITNISFNAWNDKNACIGFSGYLKNNRALSGKANRASISYSGSSGNLIAKKTLDDSHVMAKVLSGFYFLHFLPDEGIIVRLLFLIFGIIFGTSLIFGLLIWLEKKALKYKEDKNYFSFLSRFSLALTVGIIPTTGFIIFLYWLIPFYTIDKQTWVIGGFYSFWCFTLFLSIYKDTIIESIKIFMKMNAILLLLAVILHGLRTKYFIWDSFQSGIYEIFFIDIALLLFAILSLLIAKKLPDIKLLQRI